MASIVTPTSQSICSGAVHVDLNTDRSIAEVSKKLIFDNSSPVDDEVKPPADQHIAQVSKKLPCFISSLPDSVLLKIACYSAPPDMFSLAQTCSKFHTQTHEITNSHILSPSTSSRFRASTNNTNLVKNLATRLVKESLVHGLIDVLQRSNASVSTKQAHHLVDLQSAEKEKGRLVLLSGSTLVQTVTGKRFDDFDIDIYCVKESLLPIRKLLVEELGLILQSVFPSYDYEGGRTFFPRLRNDEASSNVSNIHHVESYVMHNESTTKSSVASVRRSYSEAVRNVDPTGERNSLINRRNACLHSFQRLKRFKFDKDFFVTTTPSGNGPKAIDVVVCLGTPQETINHFDLDICKCTFDGDAFRIISPDVFSFRTTASKFNELGNRYCKYLLQCSPTNSSNEEFLTYLQSREVSNEKMMLIMQCFLRAGVEQGCKLPFFGNGNDLMNDNAWGMVTPEYFRKLHNKVVTQLKRIVKYIERGIDVTLVEVEIMTRFLTLTRANKRRRVNL